MRTWPAPSIFSFNRSDPRRSAIPWRPRARGMRRGRSWFKWCDGRHFRALPAGSLGGGAAHSVLFHSAMVIPHFRRQAGRHITIPGLGLSSNLCRHSCNVAKRSPSLSASVATSIQSAAAKLARGHESGLIRMGRIGLLCKNYKGIAPREEVFSPRRLPIRRGISRTTARKSRVALRARPAALEHGERGDDYFEA